MFGRKKQQWQWERIGRQVYETRYQQYTILVRVPSVQHTMGNYHAADFEDYRGPIARVYKQNDLEKELETKGELITTLTYGTPSATHGYRYKLFNHHCSTHAKLQEAIQWAITEYEELKELPEVNL